MCGICGIIDFNNAPVNEAQVRKMMRVMKHRGPDDEGVYNSDHIGLGFVRLSILDLSPEACQPLVSSDNNFVIVFNGEIYNYIELRSELETKGFTYCTKTDTEVLLTAYQYWGDECLEHLNGMFAFVIYDRSKKTLFAARDRFGIKPFYYAIEKNRFYFSSDIPPILSVLDRKPEADEGMVYDFMVFNRTNHTERTFFSGIKKLQHGHKINFTTSNFSIKCWYNLEEHITTTFDAPASLLEALKNSVSMQLRSDVPIGTCLSGGIDSSAITSLVLDQYKGSYLHSFSAVYGKGMHGDESEFIQEYKNKNLEVHYTIPTAESFLSDIDDYLNALSEPVPNTSEYAEFKVMQLAKQNCTVLLNGQGADEIFAGYHYFFGYYFKDLFKSFQWLRLISEMYSYVKLHKSLYGIKTFIYTLFYPLLKNKGRGSAKFLSDSFNCSELESQSIVLRDFYSAPSLRSFLLRHFQYKFEHHLLWADKSGMWFSLETRFPFLDHNIVEKALALNGSDMLRKSVTKYFLRESLRGIVPEKILKRKDKIGYATPQDHWVKDPEVMKFMKEVFNSETFLSRKILNPDYFHRLLKDVEQGKKINSEFLWKGLHLELWYKKFIDG